MTHYKQMLLSIPLLLCTFFAGAAEIALKPEQIRPLLNGQSVPAGLQVQDSKGATVDLSALLAEQKTILVFYRGGWCPYCNTQLAGLRDISPQLEKARLPYSGGQPRIAGRQCQIGANAPRMRRSIISCCPTAQPECHARFWRRLLHGCKN